MLVYFIPVVCFAVSTDMHAYDEIKRATIHTFDLCINDLPVLHTIINTKYTAAGTYAHERTNVWNVCIIRTFANCTRHSSSLTNFWCLNSFECAGMYLCWYMECLCYSHRCHLYSSFVCFQYNDWFELYRCVVIFVYGMSVLLTYLPFVSLIHFIAHCIDSHKRRTGIYRRDGDW